MCDTCKKVAAGTGGLGLANFGLSLMIYTVSRYHYGITNNLVVLGFVYVFLLFGLINVSLYLARFFAYIFTDRKELYLQDLSKPGGIATIGAFSMAICLLVCLPGTHIVLQTLRDIFLVWGLVMLFPSCIIMFYRVLRSPIKSEHSHHHKDSGQLGPLPLIVANNPSVAMMQAAFSISAAAWFCSPLTGFDHVSPSYGAGGIFGHIMFALSTWGFLCTLIAIWQRRVALYHFGGNPMWAGVTFPFANTALTAGLYGRAHPKWLFDPGAQGQGLRAWILLLSALAAWCIICVNVLYVRHLFFAFPTDIAPKVVLVAVAVVDANDGMNKPMNTLPVLV